MDERTITRLLLNFGHTVDHLCMLIFPTALIAMATELGGTYGELLPLSLGGFIAFGAGSLPAGLTLASNGTLSGTPTAGGSFNFTVTATDTADSSTGAQAYTLTVNAPTITVKIGRAHVRTPVTIRSRMPSSA